MAADLKQIIPEYFAYLDGRVEQLIKTPPLVRMKELCLFATPIAYDLASLLPSELPH